MVSGPWAFFPPRAIADATKCPGGDVTANWPLVHAALDALGIADRPTQLAAIGTIAIETARTFRPVREAFWLSEEWRRANLRYYPYYGRGYVQLTWESNYRAVGAAIGVDLVADPDRALDPLIAAQALARYFATHGGGPLIPQAARRGDWGEVRRLVQGGSAGLGDFLAIVTTLQGAPAMTVRYNRDEPNIAQDDPWSCAPTSARWGLKALGRNPSAQWIEDTMLAEGVVSKQDGLLDATGAGLAAFLKRQYGEFGYDANHEPSVTWDWAVHEGGQADGSGHQYPVLLGGRGWGHWAALRDFDPQTGRLLLMNPSPGWMGVQHDLDEATFNALGPWSAVRVVHPDLFAPAPSPEPPAPDPKAALRERFALIERELAALKAELLGV